MELILKDWIIILHKSVVFFIKNCPKITFRAVTINQTNLKH